jgi:hypothetical protein
MWHWSSIMEDENFLIRPGELLNNVGGFKLPAAPSKITVAKPPTATPTELGTSRANSKLLLSDSDKLELRSYQRWTSDPDKICRMWLAAKCLTEESDYHDWAPLVEEFLAQK